MAAGKPALSGREWSDREKDRYRGRWRVWLAFCADGDWENPKRLWRLGEAWGDRHDAARVGLRLFTGTGLPQFTPTGMHGIEIEPWPGGAGAGR